jgi:hypothetical protein
MGSIHTFVRFSSPALYISLTSKKTSKRYCTAFRRLHPRSMNRPVRPPKCEGNRCPPWLQLSEILSTKSQEPHYCSDQAAPSEVNEAGDINKRKMARRTRTWNVHGKAERQTMLSAQVDGRQRRFKEDNEEFSGPACSGSNISASSGARTQPVFDILAQTQCSTSLMSLWRKNTLGLSYLSGAEYIEPSIYWRRKIAANPRRLLQDHGSRSMYS